MTQRDVVEGDLAEYRACMQTKKVVGGFSAGQLKKMLGKAGSLVRAREQAEECTDLTRQDLRRCLGRSERCLGRTKESSKERRLTTYIKAGEARGRLVRVGHGRWKLLWQAEPPPKVDPPFKERVPKKRRVCAATAEIRARRLVKRTARTLRKDPRGGHAGHSAQARRGGCFAKAEPQQRLQPFPQVSDVAAARAYLARLAAQEAAQAPGPRLLPDQPDRTAQQSAPRGVVVELWPLTHGPPGRPKVG